MSKKPQKNEQRKPQRHQIVDQQNEPFLKTLSKKVRNINKKLTEIADLEHKQNLKPEQVDKVNRKAQLQEEKNKIEQTSALFKQTYQDNAEQYRQQQLKELENLAKAITLFHAFPKFNQNDKLATLWSGLQQVNGDNLTSAVENLTTVLKGFANDYKLQKAITTFTTDNAETLVTITESAPQVQIVEVHTDEVIVYHEETVNAQGEPEQIDIIEKIHDGVVEEVTIEITHDVPAVQEEVKASAPVATEEKAKEEGKVQDKSAEEKPRPKKYDRPYRENRDRKEYQERRGEGRTNYKEGAEKKTYKPKYEAKKPEPKEDDSLSSDSSVEARGFKRDEISKLEEQGFTVVSKPKPKARDQQAYHQHQHGKKPRTNGQN